MPTGKKKFSLTVGYCRTIPAQLSTSCAGSSKILVSSSNIYLFIRAADVERR
jgi:hypothetical protein